jgi:hypothetical protein
VSAVQDKIVEAFLAELANSDAVDAQKRQRLKALLDENEKPKPDALVKIFELPAGNDIR